MSDHIEAALQPSTPPIDVSVLKPIEVVRGGNGLHMAGAALLLERVLEADQQYLDAVQTQQSSNSELANLAHQAQVARSGRKFAPAYGLSFKLVIPEADVTFILPRIRKGKWGGYECYDHPVTTADLSSVPLASSHLHGGIAVPGKDTKEAFVRMDVEGLRTRQGSVQLCIGLAALETIELVPTPPKDDINDTARRIGTTLGLVVN